MIEVSKGFADLYNSMRVFSNPCDVIKILFSDWTMQIFIVAHKHIHITLIRGTFQGFMDLRNTIRAFSNFSDVIKILFSDWTRQIFLAT